MKNLRNFLSTQKAMILIVMILLLPTLGPLTKPGFFPTQDFIHVARLFEMDKIVKDGQFPARWVPDFRYGDPTFNFYAPLPFYVGSLVHNMGFNFIQTIKILFGLSLILSALAMYFLGKEIFGKLGGLFAATLYTYAPYHSVDIYVRGALSEAWALVFFPLIYLLFWKLSKQTNKKNLVFLSLAWAGLFFTHNIMTVLFTPFALLWGVFLIWQQKSLNVAKYFLLALILGFALGSSFLLPAFFEKGFVQSDRLITGYFDFRAHFVELKQFVTPFWGYGGSTWGPEDGMSFQVGIAHLAILSLSVLLAIIFNKTSKPLPLVSFLTLEFLFSLFMQHNKSTPIWLQFPLLAYTQFPWRFLGISIFILAITGASIVNFFKGKLAVAMVVVGLIIILVNIGYFHPESFYYDSIDDHYASPKVLNQDDKLPKDYLPIWVKKIEEEKFTQPQVRSGIAQVENFQVKSAAASFDIKVQENADIEIPITFFPGWEVFVDGKLVNLEDTSNLGLIKVIIPQGEHRVELKLSNTLIRNLGNALSMMALLIVMVILMPQQVKARFIKK